MVAITLWHLKLLGEEGEPHFEIITIKSLPTVVLIQNVTFLTGEGKLAGCAEGAGQVEPQHQGREQ